MPVGSLGRASFGPGLIESIGGGCVETFEQVAVGVERGFSRGMTQACLDRFGMLSLCYQHGNVGVSEIVEPHGLTYRSRDGGQPPSDANSFSGSDCPSCQQRQERLSQAQTRRDEHSTRHRGTPAARHCAAQQTFWGSRTQLPHGLLKAIGAQ